MPLLLFLLLAFHASLISGQALCMLAHCAKLVFQCQADPQCKQWLNCNRGCSTMACQMRCGDLYTNEVVNIFSACMLSEWHCIPQRKDSCYLPQSGSVYSDFRLEMLTGHWFITAGWNPFFDCFDCQSHHFTLDRKATPKRLHGLLNYRVKKDLKCTGKSCDYIQRQLNQSWIQDPAMPGHLINHNNTYLNYADDWFVLSASEHHVLVYYCGCNDAWCGYSGSILYTRHATLPPSIIRPVTQAMLAANIPNYTFDVMCHPDVTVKGCK